VADGGIGQAGAQAVGGEDCSASGVGGGDAPTQPIAGVGGPAAERVGDQGHAIERVVGVADGVMALPFASAQVAGLPARV